MSGHNLLERWIAALRSGEYRQTHGTLRDDVNGGYCCLGVLQMVANGEVERWEDTTPMAIPSTSFWHSVGVSNRFEDRKNLFGTGVHIDTLIHMNDSGDYTFNDIADKLEAGRG